MLADTSMEVVLGMPFLNLSIANMQFVEKELEWRSYTTVEALPTTKKVELINKRKFAAIALDKNAKTFVVYVATLSAPTSLTTQVYPFRQAQFGLLLTGKTLVEVPSKYWDFPDIFLFDLVMELPENTSTNEHTIKLIKNKQPPYGPIYSLRPVELEILKTYIETNLKTGFI